VRYVVQIWNLLGLIAFIVPGIVRAFRCALVDSVALVERVGPTRARSRSEQLLAGHVYPTVAGIVVVFGAFSALTVPLALFVEDDSVVLRIVVVTATEVAFSVFPITLYLWYRELAAEHDDDPTLEHVAGETLSART
jgi:uncharacterized membrane protein